LEWLVAEQDDALLLDDGAGFGGDSKVKIGLAHGPAFRLDGL